MKFDEPSRYEIPTVLTHRLRLRSWRAEDVEPYTSMMADPAMRQYTSGPVTEQRVWAMHAFQIGHWALRGFGMWIAEERTTGNFLGRVGLYEELGWPGVEVAWTVRHDRWGEGFATEGGAAALEFAFDQVGVDEVISIIHPQNAPSLRVAEKLHMQVAREDEVHGEPRLILSIAR